MPDELLLATPPDDRAGDGSKAGTRKRRAEQRAAARFAQCLDRVREWAARRPDRVAKVYLVVEADGVHLHVVGVAKNHDPALRQSLSELLLALADDGHAVFGAVIPDGTREELAAFFDPDAAFTLARG